MTKLKLGLISAGLILSCSSFAFSPDCCVPGYNGICAPKLKGGFYLGVTGAYVQPTESGLGQVTDSWQYIDSRNPSALEFRSEDRSIDPDYDWLWAITAGYDFACTAYNLEANYTHMQKNTTPGVNLSTDGPVSFSSYFFPNGFFPILAPVGNSLVFLRSDARLRYELDQADLKLGHQFTNVCNQFKIHASVGARYADLDHRFTFYSPSVLQIVTPGAPTTILAGPFIGEVKSDFQGVGPLASLDLRYGFCSGFGILGRFNTALLIGQINSHNFITSELAVVSPITTPVNSITNRFNRPEIDHVVPNIDAKLGIDYNFCFCNRSSLTLEVGYQVNKYWEAFNLLRGDISQTVDLPQQRFVDIVTTNYTVRGPYATISYHM